MILIIQLVTFIVFSSGCWDYTEYDQMTQIYSLGVDLDQKSKEVTVTLQYIPVTKSSVARTPDLNKGTVYSATALTIVDALTKLQQASPNRLFYGYLQVILIGEDAAKYIMKDLIVYFERTPGLRNSASIIIVPGKAEGTIATRDPNSVTSSGKKIRMLLNSYKSSGATYLVTLHDFLMMMVRPGVEPIAPRIITTPPINDTGKSLGGTQDGIRFAIEKHGNLMAGGMAAFKKDKFVGWLNDKETLGLNWILNNKVTFYKTANLEDSDLNTNSAEEPPLEIDLKKSLYFYITKSKSRVKVKIEDNKPVIYLDVKIEAALRKYYSDQGFEYITPDKVNLIEKKIEKSIYSDIAAALKKGKDELDSDIFGFGFKFYRQHPKEWHKYYEKNWDSIFRDVRVEVNVDTKLNNTGTNIKQFFEK